MKNIVPVILAVTAILAGLTIAIINQGNYLKGYGWAIPYLFALIAVLLILATVIAVINSKREREKKNDLPPPPSVHQESKQIVSQSFSPHFHFGPQDDVSVTAKVERARHERVILDFLKRSEHRFYLVGEIAEATNISKPDTRVALERLEIKKSVFKIPVDAPGDYLWKLDDLERDDQK